MPNVPYSRQHADEHTAELIGWYLGLSETTAGRMTDLNPGSNLRDIFEAVAIKLEGLDTAVFTGLRAAIPMILFEWFGVGDGVNTFVGFPALPALPARGIARFVRAGTDTLPAITIPAGTRLAPPVLSGQATLIYATDEDATLLPLETTVDVVITANIAGPASSIGAGNLYLVDTITGIASATNPTSLVGVPPETEEQRRQRFMVYVRNLARCQLEGLEAGAMTGQVVQDGRIVEHVLEACAIEPPDKRGLVDLFIDNGNGSATPELVTNVQQIIDGYVDDQGARIIGYKAAGIVVRVKPVTPTAIPVTVAVTIDPLLPFPDVQVGVMEAIGRYIYGLGIGNDLIWTELTAAIATAPGVLDHTLASPAGNVDAGVGGRIIPGVVTVTRTQ